MPPKNLTMFSRTTASASASESSEHDTYQSKVNAILEGVDIDLLAGLIAETKNQVEQAQNRKLFLLVGRTGSGKSAILNRLMGSRLQRVDGQGLGANLTLADGEVEYAPIGNGTDSTTLHPKVVPMNGNNDLAYVDCPGFDDKRSREETLCASIGLPMAISYARDVQGLIVVIDCGDLTATLGEGFIALANTLSQLLKNPENLLGQAENSISNNIIYVFNKVPAGKNLSHIMSSVNDKKRSIEQKIERLGRDSKIIEGSLAQLAGMSDVLSTATTEAARQDIIVRIMAIIPTLSGERALNAQRLMTRLDGIRADYFSLIGQLHVIQMIINNPTNCFAAMPEENGSVQPIIDKLLGLCRISAIPKEQFTVSSNVMGPWLILDKIMEKIASTGGQLLCLSNSLTKEASSLKKYYELLDALKTKETRVLERLSSSAVLSDHELQQTKKELFNLAQLTDFIARVAEVSEAEKQKLSHELAFLSSTEPTRYEHRSLAPVIFKRRRAALTTAYGVTGLLGWAVTCAVGIPLSLIASMGGAGREMLGLFTNHGMNAWLHGMEHAFRRSHHFHYNDIPYVSFERKCEPAADYSEVPKDATGRWHYGDDPGGFENDRFFRRGGLQNEGKIPSGFDLRTEVTNPDEGIYTIDYINAVVNQLDNVTVWIEMFVQRKLHPEFRTRIKTIETELSRPDADRKLIGHLNAEQTHLTQTIRDDEALIARDDELQQKTLCDLLTRRLESYPDRLDSLRNATAEYTSKIARIDHQLQELRPSFTLLSQIQGVLHIRNSYISNVMKMYEQYQTGAETLRDSILFLDQSQVTNVAGAEAEQRPARALT